MTTFHDRDMAFEAKYAYDEELKFLAAARREKLFAGWAAERLGLSDAERANLVASTLALHPVRSDLLEAPVNSVRIAGVIGIGPIRAVQPCGQAQDVLRRTFDDQDARDVMLKQDRNPAALEIEGNLVDLAPTVDRESVVLEDRVVERASQSCLEMLFRYASSRTRALSSPAGPTCCIKLMRASRTAVKSDPGGSLAAVTNKRPRFKRPDKACLGQTASVHEIYVHRLIHCPEHHPVPAFGDVNYNVVLVLKIQ